MTFLWRFSLLLIFCYSISEIKGSSIFVDIAEDTVIQWTINPAPGDQIVAIIHPTDEVLYSALDTGKIPGSDSFKDRVTNTGNTDTITGHIEFTLNDVRVTDAGDYKAKYLLPGGAQVRPVGATLVVYVKPSKPVITVVTAPYVRQDMVLKCTASSNSKPDGQLTMDYKWQLSNADLPTDSKYVPSGSHLTVKNIQKSDKDSTFTCKGYEKSSLPSDASEGYKPDITYGPEAVKLAPSSVLYDTVENDNIGQIACSADCNPACTYQWKFNNGNIGGQSEILNLDSIQRGQAGSYFCTARNNHGIGNSNTIVVNVKHGPGTVILSPDTLSYNLIEVTQNTLGAITCSSDCNPTCTFEWSRDGTVIRSVAVLELTGATRADDGTYTCNASNSYGNKESATVIVTVEYKPGVVTLSPATEQYTIDENGNIGPITCSTDCNPQCIYQWKFKSSNIGGQTLTMNTVQRGSSGSYRCTATNKYGSRDSKTITITVQYGPEAVTLSPSTQEYKLIEATKNTLDPITCSADCMPPCAYQWSRNGKVIISDAVLNMSEVTRAENGIYTCKANNTYGQISTEVNVIVEYKPENLKILPDNNLYVLLESDRLGPIMCSSTCKPACTFKWRHNRVDFPNGDTFDVTRINRNQTGTYTCVATNIHGKIESYNISVVVEYPPDKMTIREIIPEEDMNENVTFSVICSTDSVPSPDIRIWLTGGETNVIYEKQSVLQVNYTKSAECLNTGEYFCDAINKYGNSTSRKIEINVVCSPRPSEGIKTDNVVTVGNKEDLDITGVVVANPRPNISWTFQRGGNNDSILIRNETEDVAVYMSSNHVTYNSRVVKENTGATDLGNYVMNATNFYGFVLLNYHVSSKRSPEPPYEIKVTCDITKAQIEWISNFNGGVTQEFIIGINKSSQIHGTDTVADKGMGKRHQQTVSNLDPNTKYSFAVNAKNSIGSSTIPPSIYCTTRPSNEKPGIPAALIGGIAGGSFFLLILVIILAVVFLHKRRKSEKDDSNELVNRRGMPSQDHTDDGIRQNILYESAGPFLQQQNDSAADCQYAAVDKSTKKQNNSADVYATVDKSVTKQNNSSDVYAEVEKKGKKQKPEVKKAKPKGTQKKATEKPSGEVYVNVGGNFEDEIANSSKAGPKDKAGKEKPQTKTKPSAGKAGKGKSSSRRKNKDGLIYVDVEFGDPGKNKLNGIHGIEKRVDYVDIDFTRRADPLPSDDEEEDDGGKKNENGEKKSEEDVDE